MPTARRALAETLEGRRLYAVSPLTYGGGGFDDVSKTAQAPNGDIITTGLFSGTTNFARPGQRAAVLVAQGDTDIYVADYRADGTLRWAVRIGGDYSNTDLEKFKDRDLEINQTRFSRFVGKISADPRRAGEYANDVAVDSAGNVYLAGAFRSTIKAGRTTLTADDEYTSDYYDALVVKIAANGTVSWARKFGGAFDDDALSIGLDAAGTPIIGGYFSRTADFSTGKAKHQLQTDGRDGGFVLRLSAAGDYVWAYDFQSDALGTDERNAVNDIAVTARGDVYFAGTYASTAKFDGRDGFTLDSQGKTDAVLGEVNRKGQFVFAESSGGNDYDGNTSVAIDSAGNVYTAGYFSGENTDVDPRPDVETDYTATPEDGDSKPTFSDILVSKFTSTGTPVWIDQMGGGYIELVADLTIGTNGDVYTTGSFFNTADFGPNRTTAPLSSTLTNAGSIKDNNTDFGRNETYDWFVSALSPRGKFVSAIRIGGQDDDYAGGLTQLLNGDVLVYGRTTSARGDDRDDRNEQSLIEELLPDLSKP